MVAADARSRGRTARLLVDHVRRFGPASLSLYLGHTKGIQPSQNVPGEIDKVYVAEDCLDWANRDEDERSFIEFFGRETA